MKDYLDELRDEELEYLDMLQDKIKKRSHWRENWGET
tara:strand:+ start:911 stop:1021 length:111 start_codon:yes stop_codon:yes gene_type:complete